MTSVDAVAADDYSIQQRGGALHHDDEAIVEYCRGVQQRRDELFANRERISVVLPWNARRILERLDTPFGFPSQAETAPGQMPTRGSTEHTWAHCQDIIHGLTERPAEKSVMVFDGRRLLAPMRQQDPEPRTPGHKARSTIIEQGLHAMRGSARPDGHLRVPSLPDCWIWVSESFLHANRFLTAGEAFPRFLDAVGRAHSEFEELRRAIRSEEVRVISVSRARYNPRFRGRLVTDEHAAKPILLHAALCISAANSAAGYDWKAGEESADLPPRFMRRRASDENLADERVPH